MTQQAVLDVMIILERGDGHLLLAERAGTGYADGQLNLPSGKVEPGENVIDAVVREAREEVAVCLAPSLLRPVHVMHLLTPECRTRIGWFFATAEWAGRPTNAEPHKCAGIAWHSARDLPANTVPYHAIGIDHYLRGEPFSVHGW